MISPKTRPRSLAVLLVAAMIALAAGTVAIIVALVELHRVLG